MREMEAEIERGRVIESDWREMQRDKGDLVSSINQGQNVSAMQKSGFQEDIQHMEKTHHYYTRFFIYY